MNECVECGVLVSWNPRSHICSECLEKEINIRILNEDRTVESPHSSWF